MLYRPDRSGSEILCAIPDLANSKTPLFYTNVMMAFTASAVVVFGNSS